MIRVGAAPGRSQAKDGANPKHHLKRAFQTPFDMKAKDYPLYCHTFVPNQSITLFHIGSVLTKGLLEGLPSLYPPLSYSFLFLAMQRELWQKVASM